MSAAALAICMLILWSARANATDLTLPVGGRVSIELVFSDAAFRNTLALQSPSAAITASGCALEGSDGLPGLKLFSEKTSRQGCRVDLDADPATPGIQPFPASAVLQFNFCAQFSGDATCEFVWSSNPAGNSDSKDHLRITPLSDADFPGRIFRLNWEDESGLGDSDFNDLIAVVRVDIDSDSDGLWDDWEKSGIDSDGNGTIDLDLPALGADPNHRDIFLEIDSMSCGVMGGDCSAGDTHNHTPKAAAIAAAVASFAAAPIMNPDGTTGIDLHVDLNDTLVHQNFVSIGCGFPTGGGVGAFDDVKTANFGNTNPRRFAYHYVVFGHQQSSTTTSSGCAEEPGNDVLVTLGGWNVGSGDLDGDGLPDARVGTIQQQAGTLMHELGHNLDLDHGGADGVNRKPNYLSVMSYSFQTRGIPPTDPDGAGPLTNRIDYSRSALPALNENSLNEPAGVGDGTDSTLYFCPGAASQTLSAASGPIDWNCDGDRADASVVSDTNADGVFGVLNGSDDWTRVRLAFQSTGSYEDGQHPEFPADPEIDFAQHLLTPAASLSIDIDPLDPFNIIHTRVRGVIPVAILSTPTFNARTDVMRNSLTFGASGDEDSLAFCGLIPFDVNFDRRPDLVCYFATAKTELVRGSTSATLKGLNANGEVVLGSGRIRTSWHPF